MIVVAWWVIAMSNAAIAVAQFLKYWPRRTTQNRQETS